MLTRSKAAIVAAVVALSCGSLVVHADTGAFISPLTNAFLSVDINGGPLDTATDPTNGYNENTSAGAFSADNFGVVWSPWGGPTYSGGDGTQLPNSGSQQPATGGVGASSITTTFTFNGPPTSDNSSFDPAFTGQTPLPAPVTATIGLNTTTNSAFYGQFNSLPTLNSRDRGSPNGANGLNDNDMFRDLLFTLANNNVQGTNYMQFQLSGLTPGSNYTLAVYSYDSQGGHLMNWSATAPIVNANNVTGYWASTTDNTNTFTAPVDEQTITITGGTTPAPALFTLPADANGDITVYGWGGDGITGDQSADTTYINGFQIAAAAVTTPLLGDANGDGKVDAEDLNIVLNHLGETDSLRSDGNFDGALTIDLNDLNDVLNNLSSSPGGGSARVATPEPATAGLLLAFGAIACVRRRR